MIEDQIFRFERLGKLVLSFQIIFDYFIKNVTDSCCINRWPIAEG